MSVCVLVRLFCDATEAASIRRIQCPDREHHEQTNKKRESDKRRCSRLQYLGHDMIQPAILSSGLRVVPLAILDEEAGTQHAGKRHRTTTLQKPASSRLKYVRTASEGEVCKKGGRVSRPRRCLLPYFPPVMGRLPKPSNRVS